LNHNTDKISDNKFPIIKISILFFIALFYILYPVISAAKTDIRDSMVKIYSVQNKPDYDNPWNMDGPESGNGSGCVISGNRILTNAHVISDQTFIQIRLYGQSKKYPAKVLAVSHEADLALITPVDASLLTGVPSLQIGDLPEAQQEITVYGFPEGGETLSTTTGVISRIEHQIYIHSIQDLLAAQIDAAINRGNSGGPVILENKIVGIAMQLRKESENIGYMVPAPIIKHLLVDLDDGNYNGFPKAGMALQKVENQSLKKMYSLKDGLSGVLITDIIPGSPASKKLFPGDIILSIDGHSVADDGTVEFRPKERTDFSYYIQQHQIGEAVSMNIFRKGREELIELTLDKNWRKPMLRHDVRPTYYIYGGLVFCPLTINYLMTWGDDWRTEAPTNLMNAFYETPSKKGEEIVVITKVLPSEVNNGYDDFIDERIVEVVSLNWIQAAIARGFKPDSYSASNIGLPVRI